MTFCPPIINFDTYSPVEVNFSMTKLGFFSVERQKSKYFLWFLKRNWPMGNHYAFLLHFYTIKDHFLRNTWNTYLDEKKNSFCLSIVDFGFASLAYLIGTHLKSWTYFQRKLPRIWRRFVPGSCKRKLGLGSKLGQQRHRPQRPWWEQGPSFYGLRGRGLQASCEKQLLRKDWYHSLKTIPLIYKTVM